MYVADSFKGLPPPDPKYKHDAADVHSAFDFLTVSVDQVKSHFQKYNLLEDNVVFIKGFFETSVNAGIEKHGELRLDGDMYSSTIQVLDRLYDKLSIRGYVIIDDYNCLHNCKAAVNDFRAKRAIITPMIQIDWSGCTGGRKRISSKC